MTTTPSTPDPTTLAETVRQLEDHNQLLAESLVDAQLALEDRGWAKIGAGLTGLDEFGKPYLNQAARQCRASAVINPLIGRALNLRIAYVWGGSVNIAARDADSTEGSTGSQDVNTVVQAFLDDPLNRAAFTSGQAHEENERALGTDGNVILVLVTSPLTGRVQVRSVPFTAVDDMVRNPDDADDVWFLRRTATVESLVEGPNGLQTVPRTETVYHPLVTFRPRMRPKTLNGHEIRWDQPVVHVSVNRMDGWRWGIGDVYSAISWARGYAEFLQDWSRLMKALAKIAYTATAKTTAGAAKMRQQLAAAEAGSTVTVAEGQPLTAVSKSGATIDAGSGRPLAAMVASATDLPVTMLLSDPGVTGARATAETLDKPLELLMQMRQQLWADVIRAVLGHVIDAAVRAPQGPLRGTIVPDPITGRDVIKLLGGQDRTIDVVFPDLDDIDPAVLVTAIKTADDTGKLPPLLVAHLLMQALSVDDIDDWLEKLQDDDGQFIDQADLAAARSVLGAVARGDFPADAAA